MDRAIIQKREELRNPKRTIPARTFHVLFGTKTGTQGEEERRFPCEENDAKLLIGAGAGDVDEPDTATSPIPATELDISTALCNKPVTTLLPDALLSLFRASSGISECL
jgi:hypothetical protein